MKAVLALLFGAAFGAELGVLAEVRATNWRWWVFVLTFCAYGAVMSS